MPATPSELKRRFDRLRQPAHSADCPADCPRCAQLILDLDDDDE